VSFIGDGTLVGPHAYLQGLGGLCIGAHVGVGAGVLMLTAVHAETPPGEPITSAPLRYRRIDVGDGCDLGIGSMLLPGASLGAGKQVGAGAGGSRAARPRRGHRRDTRTHAALARRRGLGPRAPGAAARQAPKNPLAQLGQGRPW